MYSYHRSFQYVLLRFVCILLGIVLTVLLSVTLYFRNMLNRIDYVSPDAAPLLSQEELNSLLSTDILPGQGSDSPALDPEAVDFSEHDTIIGGKGSDLVNILLIGQDRREGETFARSDSMILCSFNTKSKEITMTSFLRDLYVEIPGYDSNRLNAAYAAGGMGLLSQTLYENFGVHIDGCVEVDFTQFSQVIDLLGGVSMELRQDEAEAINAAVPGTLTEGTQWLTGSQALAYSRIRNLDSDGDFSRTNRQRKLITALIRSYKDANLSAVLTMMTEALPMLSTDLSEGELLRYAIQLFPMLSGTQIRSQRIPADGTYANRTIHSMSVLVADLDAARNLLEETLLGSGG